MAIEHEDTVQIHRFAFVQSTSPGAVGPYKAWVDTSVAPAQLKVRNAANTVWVPIGIWDNNIVQLSQLDPDPGDMIHHHLGTWNTLSVAQLKTNLELNNVTNVNASLRANHTGTQLSSTISNFTSSVGTALGTQFSPYLSTLTSEVSPTINDDGIIRKADGTIKRMRSWRFGTVTTSVPTPIEVDDGCISIDDIPEVDDGNRISVITGGADIYCINIQENDARWIVFLDGGGRLVSGPTLKVPGNIINIATGDQMQVVKFDDGIVYIIQYVSASTQAETMGAPAMGYIKFNENPANGETKDFNGLEVTFTTTGPATFPDVLIGATRADTMANLVSELNDASNSELIGAEYVNGGSGNVLIIYNEKGEEGNDYNLDGGTADFTTSASSLEGGRQGLEQTKQDSPLAAVLTEGVVYNNVTTLAATELSVDVVKAGWYKVDLVIFTWSAVRALHIWFDGFTPLPGPELTVYGTYELFDVDDPGGLLAISSLATNSGGPDESVLDGLSGMIRFTGVARLLFGNETFTVMAAQRMADASNTEIHPWSSLVLTPLRYGSEL